MATQHRASEHTTASARSAVHSPRGRLVLAAAVAALLLIGLLALPPVKRIWDRTIAIDAARLDESLAATAQPAHFEAVEDTRHYPIDMRPFADVVDSQEFATPAFDDRGVVQIDRQVEGGTIRVYNPVSAAQYALGSYERYLHGSDDEAYRAFIRHAESLRDHMDESGRLSYEFDVPSYNLKAPWISAMAQGQAISVFVRAAHHTGDSAWFDYARLALQPMLIPVDEGGVLYVEEQDVWLEEYPEDPPSHVFNGHVFAAFGLRDLMNATGDPDAKRLWEAAINTLGANLELFEEDGWLRYDLKNAPVAGRQYYQIQLDQARLLAAFTGDDRFAQAVERWDDPYEDRDAWLRQRFLERLQEALSRKL